MFNLSKLLPKYCINLATLRFGSSASKFKSGNWEYDAKPFSNLNISLKNCSVKVTTADVVTVQDKLLINAFSSTNSSKQPTITTKENETRIEHSEPGNELEISTPIAVNLTINLEGEGNVDVSSVETDQVNITTEQAHVTLSSIKATNINCVSQSGNINTVKSLHGNIKLSTKEGAICTGRIQGPVVELSTEEGDINCQDTYAEELIANSVSGDMIFKSIHGITEMNTDYGNIFIGMASGKAHMSSPEGNLDVFVTKQIDMFLHTNGGVVTLYNCENNGAKIFLEACKISLDENLKASRVKKRKIGAGTHLIADLYGGGPPIVIKCGTGQTKIQGLSWIQRINHFQKNSK